MFNCRLCENDEPLSKNGLATHIGYFHGKLEMVLQNDQKDALRQALHQAVAEEPAQKRAKVAEETEDLPIPTQNFDFPGQEWTIQTVSRSIVSIEIATFLKLVGLHPR